jgi:hypothetical protein
LGATQQTETGVQQASPCAQQSLSSQQGEPGKQQAAPAAQQLSVQHGEPGKQQSRPWPQQLLWATTGVVEGVAESAGAN